MKLLSTIFFIISSVSCLAQEYEPLDLAKQIFSSVGLPKISKYVTDEYKGKPNGKDIAKVCKLNFLLLEQTENQGVVSMTVLDSLGKGFDAYLFFKKETIWKMSAFRGLAMTGIIEQMVLELEKMTPQEIEKVINDAQKNKNKENYYPFTTREEYDFMLGNAKLILELDDNIIKHFQKNKNEFERLKSMALKEKDNQEPKENTKNLIESEAANYKKLFISGVSFGGYITCNCLNFSIGGMIDNTVGYIYVEDKKNLPSMNPSRIIMLREIADGWYLYKTT